MRLIGVDVGGTFTDLALATPRPVDGGPQDMLDARRPGPRRGLGPRRALRRHGSRRTIDGVLHGTTVATNAVLEHDGAVTGMITTEGFRDIVHIGRHQRPQHYSVMQDIPWQSRPFVSAATARPCPSGSCRRRGEVLEPLDEDAVRAAARELREAGVEAVAVCFLFSYLDPAHEGRAPRSCARRCPGAS